MTRLSKVKEVAWYWADDSKKGSQDVWVKYNTTMCKKLEAEFGKAKGKKKVPVDKQRYVDLSDKSDMWQCRYDDPDKMRKVKREEPADSDAESSSESDSDSEAGASSDRPESESESESDNDSDDDSDNDPKKKKKKKGVKRKSPDKPAAKKKAAAPKKTAKKKAPPKKSAKKSSTPAVKWYWADDGKGGSQTVWKIYSDDLCTKLEKAFQAQKSKCKTDAERFVDMSDRASMWQCRADNPSRRRMVKREEGDDADEESSSSEEEEEEEEKVESEESEESDSESDSDSDLDEADKLAKWFWAGDSKNGSQDVWIQYDDKFSKKLEKAKQAGESEVRVDKERYVDLKNMLQRRYDDPSKRRKINRVVPKLGKPASKQPPKKKAKLTSQPSKASVKSKAASAGGSGSDDDDNMSSVSNSASNTALLNAPPYWTDFDSMDYFEVNVSASSAEFKQMDGEVMNGTIASYHKNTQLNHKVVFSSFQVTRVVRIQNPSLWLRYNSRRKHIASLPCTPLQHVLLPQPAGAVPNEYWLLHGLNSDCLDEITQFGFDPRHCSLNGMFGAGLYFAENSSKSNQYCHAGKCSQKGAVSLNNHSQCKCTQATEVCMLVCRVLLGDPLVENKFRGNAPGQFWHGRRTEPLKPDNKTKYNSVVGECVNNFSGAQLQLREYIVYESSQIYPEYKIFYKRKK